MSNLCDGCGDPSEKLSLVMGSQPEKHVCPDCMEQLLFKRLDAMKTRVRQLKRDARGPGLTELAAAARMEAAR